MATELPKIVPSFHLAAAFVADLSSRFDLGKPDWSVSTHAARLANESRAYDRADRKEREAEHLVGELVRDGKTIHYVNLRNGKTKEGNRFELIAFLVRNHYV